MTLDKINIDQMYYYGVNNDIIEIKKVENDKVTYVQNKEEYVEDINTVKSNIEKAGNRSMSLSSKKVKKLNDKITRSNVRDDKLFIEHKELLEEVIRIVFGKRYKYKSLDGDSIIVHIDSGLEFEFDPLNNFSHATKEILPWFNVHGFLYHFKEDNGWLVLNIYNKVNDLQTLKIGGNTKNVCLLRGVVEANTLYQQNLIYNAALLNNIAKRIYRNKKLEEKQNHVLVVLDAYNEEYIEFNPLTNVSQAMDIVLREIGNVFDYSIRKINTDYILTIYTMENELVLEERNKDLKKLICIVFESLLGG